MSIHPSPGGSGEPPSFSRVDVARALAEIEIATAREAGQPIIEATIGPAEVHTLGAPNWPTQEQYRSVATRYCTQHAELVELRKELAAERRMGAETERHLRIAERSLEWHERRNASLTRALWASTACCALAVLLAAWRAM